MRANAPAPLTTSKELTNKAKAGFDGDEVLFPEPISVKDYRDALAVIVSYEQVHSKKLQEQRDRGVRVGAHPEMLRFIDVFYNRMDKLNVPVWAHTIVRTNAEQQRLYEEGVSKAKPGKGAHPFGCAADIVHSTLAWNMDPKQWEFFGQVGKELAIQRSIPIQWGGDWPPYKGGVGWDPAHWQLKNWKAVMSGYPFATE